MNYYRELQKSMNYLAKDQRTLFIGQSVEYPGTVMSETLKNVPSDKKLELPVCEDMQAGIANGLAFSGYIPVSIFPRWNFLLLATNQIVNHLDKIPEYSSYTPKVIIRTSIGSIWPWNSQAQHIGDYSDIFQSMLKNIEVIRLDNAEIILPSYKKALERDDGKSTLLVEWSDFFYENSFSNRKIDLEVIAKRHLE